MPKYRILGAFRVIHVLEAICGERRRSCPMTDLKLTMNYRAMGYLQLLSCAKRGAQVSEFK